MHVNPTIAHVKKVNSEGVYMYTFTDQSLFERSRFFRRWDIL